jgi:hypothetical protein
MGMSRQFWQPWVKPSPRQGSTSLPNSALMSLLALRPFVPLHLQSPFARFHGVGNLKIYWIFHEIIEEDKGPKFTFKGLKSPPPIDTKDTEVNPLHIIFNLEGVLIGKDYFEINHLLPPPFHLAWGRTLLGKSVVLRPSLKEFLLRWLEPAKDYWLRSMQD